MQPNPGSDDSSRGAALAAYHLPPVPMRLFPPLLVLRGWSLRYDGRRMVLAGRSARASLLHQPYILLPVRRCVDEARIAGGGVSRHEIQKSWAHPRCKDGSPVFAPGAVVNIPQGLRPGNGEFDQSAAPV